MATVQSWTDFRFLLDVLKSAEINYISFDPESADEPDCLTLSEGRQMTAELN